MPHNGCPHQCTFCNQKRITGQSSQPDRNNVLEAVEIARKTLGDKTHDAEIAFFGGSFTAIDRKYMIELLSAASPFVKSGEFCGIRLSTRPDAISREILDILKEYGVTAVELGAQSMDDKVLLLNKRGHSSADVIKACELIHEYGFELGLQMMTGLYGSDRDTDILTAKRLAELKPATMRIYPTVVMKNTELYDLYMRGVYDPPEIDAAVSLCAELLLYFEERNISVIRLGLHDSPSLREGMAGGVFHPSFRELCENKIMYNNAIKLLNQNKITSGTIEFEVNPASVSKFIGNKKSNIKALADIGIIAKVKENSLLDRYEIKIKDIR